MYCLVACSVFEGVRLWREHAHDLHVDPAPRVVDGAVVDNIRVVVVAEVGFSTLRLSQVGRLT